MKTKFYLGQIVKFKNYKRSKKEKEAYFAVVQEESEMSELALYTINSNRFYSSGATIIPEFPDEDLQIIDIKAGDLVNQEITINEDKISGITVYFNGNNDCVKFNQIGDFLVSNIEFEIFTKNFENVKGNLHVDISIHLK